MKKQELEELDKNLKLIPLTFDFALKSIFARQIDLLKEFILLELELDVDKDNCKVVLKNAELPKENYKEYKKSVDIYVTVNKDVYVDIENNRSGYEQVKRRNELYASKLYSMILESGRKSKKLKNKVLYQLNLNTFDKKVKYGEDIIVPYGIKTKTRYDFGKYIVLKYLEFYRKEYYNNIKLSESELWLVALTSTTFTELYEILGKFLSKEKKKSL